MEEETPKIRDKAPEWNTRCLFCNKEFGGTTQIIDHLRWHIKESYDEDRIRRLMQRTCPICRKVFSTPGNQKHHQLIHSAGEMTFKCHHCGQLFREQRQLNKHEQKYSESFTCDVCGEKLRLAQMGPHWRQFHPDLNRVEIFHPSKLKCYPKVCIFCNNKPFNKVLNLESHISSDIGERPFFCKICGTEFVMRVHLKRHRVKFRGQCLGMQQEKKKSSRSKNEPKRCIKKLAKIAQKVDGLRQGKGQRRQKPARSLLFLCSICDATFRNESELSDHKKNHFEEASLDLDDRCIDPDHDDDDPKKKKKEKRRKKIKFKCAFCPARFRRMERLEKHFTEVHKGNVAVDDDEDENLENKDAAKSKSTEEMKTKGSNRMRTIKPLPDIDLPMPTLILVNHYD